MSRQLKEPVVASGYNSELVTRKISDIVLKRPVTRGWLGGFAIAFALLLLLNFAIGWLLLKIFLVVSTFIWLRATFPRYRYDQIMRLGWKVFIPVTLIWIVVLGAWMQTPLWVWWGGTFE